MVQSGVSESFSFYSLRCLVDCCLGVFCPHCCFTSGAACYPFLGSMSVQRAQGLCSLTRRHAIKVTAVVSVEDCCLAIGEVVGHSGVLSASRMNNAIVIFLDSVDKANDLVEQGIVIRGEFVSVLPLSLPAKKVTLSNVPPFVSDEILTQALLRHGKLVSPIKKIPLRSESPLLKHIVSFRRFVYMIIPEDADLDLTLNFRIDDFSYTFFVTTGKIKCFGCGKTGHLIRNCPNKNIEGEKENDNAQGSEDNGVAEAVVEAAAAVSEGSAVTETAENPPGETEAEPGSSWSEQADLIPNNIPAATVSSDSMSSVSLTDKRKESTISEQVQVDVNESCEEAHLMEQEPIIFKTPQKRKMKNKSLDAKISKTDEVQEKERQDTESDSDSSECSVSFSQGEPTARSYELEDIKLFLRATKNKRGVQVQEYFPDLKLFVDRAKSLMARDCFTNKEVYRLKKIARNVGNALNNDDI